jgi:hypothetical protein
MIDLQPFRILLIVLLIQTGLAADSWAQTSNAEREVLAAVEQFGEAYRTADVQLLRSLLTDNYVHINGGSGQRLGQTGHFLVPSRVTRNSYFSVCLGRTGASALAASCGF